MQQPPQQDEMIQFPPQVANQIARPDMGTIVRQMSAYTVGHKNPSDMSGRAFWRWRIANSDVADDDWFDSSTWTFVRSDRTITQLPEGREVLIAGRNHGYSCRCCGGTNYNDVVVLLPDRAGIQHIWSYPKNVFPQVSRHAAVHIPSLNGR